MNCRYCSNNLPVEAAACPNCGRTVDPDHSESEVVEAVQVEESTTKPWLVGLGVGILVLVVGGVSFALFGNQAPGVDFSERMPADVATYVSLDVGELVSAESKAVIGEFGGLVEIVSGEEFDVDTAFGDLLEEVESDLGPDLNYSEDIASWASGSIAIGVLMSDDVFEQSGVVWISGRDESALAAFLDKMEGLAADEGVATSRVTIGGVDFIASEMFDGALVGQVGPDLLIVSDQELAQEVLALTPETSLHGSPGFADRVGLLPPNAIATFASHASALDYGSLFTGTLGFGAGGFGNTDLSELPDTGWTVGSFSVENGNIRFDGVAGIDSDLAFELSADSPALEELPGDDVIFFARLAGIGQGLEAMVEAFGPGIDDELAASTGLTLGQILGLFEVDAGLAVWPSSEPEIPVGAGFVGVGTDDAAPVVDRLNQLILESGGVVATEVPGGYLYENMVVFGSRGPLTLISSDRTLLQGAPAVILTESALYTRTSELIGSGFIPSFGADIDGILRLVDGFISDPQMLEGFACNPVRFVAGGSRTDGDLTRSVAVIEVEAPTGCG